MSVIARKEDDLSVMTDNCFPLVLCFHRHHLEISPSPFKWEVSGRALRTVSAGEPDHKVTGTE